MILVNPTISVLSKVRNRCQSPGSMDLTTRVGSTLPTSEINGVMILLAWLELEEYYISAFKDGTYPSVTRDKIFLWARLYPVNANVPLDTVGRPTGFQFACPPSSAPQPLTNMIIDGRLSLGDSVFNWWRSYCHLDLRKLF